MRGVNRNSGLDGRAEAVPFHEYIPVSILASTFSPKPSLDGAFGGKILSCDQTCPTQAKTRLEWVTGQLQRGVSRSLRSGRDDRVEKI
jgi:hypothetical protein